MTFADQLRTPRNESTAVSTTHRSQCGVDVVPEAMRGKTARHRPRTPQRPHRLCLAHIPLRGALALNPDPRTVPRSVYPPVAPRMTPLTPHCSSHCFARTAPSCRPSPQSPAMRALVQRCTPPARVIDTVRSTHRLPSTLKNYSQVRQWLQDKDTGIFVTFSAAGQPCGCSTRPPLSPGDLLSRAPCALGGCYCTRINAIKLPSLDHR